MAKRVLDPSLGRALGLGIASQSDCQVSNVDRDVQTRHFEGSLGLVTPRGELVSACADLGKPQASAESTNDRIRTRNKTPGLYTSSACCFSLSVRAQDGSARRSMSIMT